MNPTLAISLLYGSMTLGTISVLYFSFRGRVDYSSRYFLAAESLTLLVVMYLAVINVDPSYKLPPVHFLGNWLYLVGETSIIFSIWTLTHPSSIKTYRFAVAATGIYCLFMELMRAQDPNWPLLLGPLIYTGLILWTLVLCLLIKDRSLAGNPFLKWFICAELALLCIAGVRVIGFFLNNQISPVGSSASAIAIYACYVVANLFRYIAYQSIRITWVSPNGMANFLNQRLAATATENHQLLEQLISSNRLLGVSALASSLAHELSQPLTGAALQTESVKRELMQAGCNRDTIATVNKINMQLTKLSGLVRNLRKLFADRGEEFKAFNLQQTFDEVVEILEPALRAQKIQLSKSYVANPMVYGDATQIQQVLINLLNNAIEAVSANGSNDKQIELSIDQNAQSAIFTVIDNGDGFSADMQTTIFDLYKTTKEGGLGVGLWLCKEILDRHRGTISACNRPAGGAEFTVQMPLMNGESV